MRPESSFPSGPALFSLLHPSWFINAAGRRVGKWQCPLARRTQRLGTTELLSRLVIQDFVAASATPLQGERRRAGGALDESLWQVADWDFWLKLAALGPAVYHPAPLVSMRIHAASQTIARAGCADDLKRQFATVHARNLSLLRRMGPAADHVARVARYAVEVNLALSRYVAGQQAGWLSLFWGFLRLGPGGAVSFLHNSRIVERAASRIRAGIARPAPDRLSAPQQNTSGKAVNDAPCDASRKRGQTPFVQISRRAVPGKGDCPLFPAGPLHVEPEEPKRS